MLNKLRPLKLIKIKVNKRCAKNINMCYNVKYFMARLEYTKERVIKLLYLILTKS